MFDNEISKKDIEQFLISGLIKKLGIDIDNVIRSERPDFVFNIKGEKIGVELISCHSLYIETKGKRSIAKTNNELYKQLESYKRKILERGEKSKWITITFNDCIYDVERIKDISNIIFREIDACREMQHYDVCEDLKYINNVNEQNLLFDFVEVNMIDAAWCLPPKKENILECINDKNAKLSKYRNLNHDINDYWLVIDFSQDRGVDISQTSIQNIHTEFKRVYLTRYNEVVQIK